MNRDSKAKLVNTEAPWDALNDVNVKLESIGIFLDLLYDLGFEEQQGDSVYRAKMYALIGAAHANVDDAEADVARAFQARKAVK